MRRKSAAVLVIGLLALGAGAIAWDLQHREAARHAGARPPLDLRLRQLAPPLSKSASRRPPEADSDRVVIRIGRGERDLDASQLRANAASSREARPKTSPPEGATVGPEPPRPDQAAPPGGSSRYVVQPGDTLGSISTRFYDTARQVDRIRRANGLTSDAIRIGQILEIPAWRGAQASAAADEGSPTAGPPAHRTYRVQLGDTLISIARQELGDADRWREILELNGLERPSDLREGPILIPVR